MPETTNSNHGKPRPAEKDGLLDALIEGSPVAIVGLHANGTVRLWNRAAEEIFGWNRDEVIGRPYPAVPPDLEAEYQTHIADVLRGKVLRGVESRRVRKDGTIIEVSIWNRAIEQPGGPPFLVAFIADISDRRRVEAQLLQAQKMEAVGRLAGGIAHDFNNLLTAILGYSDLILDRPIDDELRADVEEIRRAGDSAAAMTAQLLAFSRKQVMQPVVLDVNRHLAERERMLARLLGEDLDIELRLARSPVLVKADVGQFEQVIFNLAVNSRDAMPDGGRLTIETSIVDLDASCTTHGGVMGPGRYALVAVSDTGQGMPPEVQKRAFEPFFTTKERGRGTGLGLATVYGIVKQSGGYIWIYSEVGHGTTVKVYLPSVDEEPASAGQHDAAGVSIPATETILVVEDNDGLRELARRTLGRQGYQVLTARAADEALQVVEQHRAPIQLLLTDVILPRMNGRLLAERLTAMQPSLKVLYMSGYTDNAIVHHGVLDAGAAFLQKPFTPSILVRRVREILSGRE